MPINLERLQDLGTVTLPNGDRFRFRWLVPATLIQLIELRERGLGDREYLNLALDRLIDDPHPAADKLRALSNEEITTLTRKYLTLANIRKERRKTEEDTVQIVSVEDARRGFDTYLDEELNHLRKSSEQVKSSFQKITANFGLIPNSLAASSIWRYLESVSRFTRVTDEFRSQWLSYHSQLLGVIQSPHFSLLDSWLNTPTNLASLYRHILLDQTMQESLEAMQRAVAAIDLPSVIRGWLLELDQNLIAWAREIREQYRSAFLIDANLQFLSDLSDQAIADMVDDALDVPKQQRPAYIAQRLFAFTSQPKFLDALLQEVNSSLRAKRRSQIFRVVHSAHANRQYLLSIPTLLAQVEGLTMQLLAEMGYVRWDRREKKWYEADPDTGTYRFSRPDPQTGRRKRIPVLGLGDLIKLVPKMEQNPLPNTLPHIRDDIRQFRNQVMHGSLTNYGSSRRSSMLLLMARIISQQLRALEESNQAAS